MSRYPNYQTKIIAGRLVTVPDNQSGSYGNQPYARGMGYGQQPRHHDYAATYSRSSDDGMAQYNRGLSMNWSANIEAQSNKARALAQTYRSVLSPEPTEDDTELIIARPSAPSVGLARRVSLCLANVSQEKLQTSYYTLAKLDMDHSGRLSIRDLWDVLLLYQIVIVGDLLEAVVTHFKAGNGKIYYKQLWHFFYDCILNSNIHEQNDEMFPVRDQPQHPANANIQHRSHVGKHYEKDNVISLSKLDAELFCELHEELKRYARKEQQHMSVSQLTASMKNCDRGATGIMGYKEMKVLCSFYLPLTETLLDKLLQQCDGSKKGWINYLDFLGQIQSAQPTYLPPIQTSSARTTPSNADVSLDLSKYVSEPLSERHAPATAAAVLQHHEYPTSHPATSIIVDKSNRKTWQSNMSAPAWVMRKSLSAKLDQFPLLERRKRWDHSAPVMSLGTLRQRTQRVDDISGLSNVSSVCSDYLDDSSLRATVSSQSEVDLSQMDGLRLISPGCASPDDKPAEKSIPMERRGTYTKSTDVRLKSVFGWMQDGIDNQPLLLSATGEMLYSYGSYIVVMDVGTGSQRFYTEHTETVCCFTVHTSQDLVASGQNGYQLDKSSKDTGDRHPEKSPLVHIWNAAALVKLHVLDLASYCQDILSLALVTKGDTDMLVMLDANMKPSLTVLRWKDNSRLDTKKLDNNHARGIIASPYCHSLMTYGKRHVVFWTMEDSNQLVCCQTDFKHYPIGDEICCAAFVSSDKAVTGDSSGTIIVWNSERHEIESCHRNVHSAAVSSLISFVSNGSWLSASVSDDVILSWQSNKKFSRVHLKVCSNVGGVRALALLKDTHVIGCMSDNSIWRINIKDGALQQSKDGMKRLIVGHSSSVTAIHQSGAGSLLAGSRDGWIQCVETKDGKLRWSCKIKGEVSALTTTGNGKYIFCGTTNARLHSIDEHSGKALEACKLSSSAIKTICISQDDSWMLVFFADGRMGLFDLDLMTLDVSFVKQVQLPGSTVEACDWSQDLHNVRLYVKPHGVTLCDLETLSLVDDLESRPGIAWLTESCKLQHLQDQYHCTATSPNCKCRTYGHNKGVTLVRYTGSYPQQPVVTLGIGPVGLVAFSSDSKRLLAVRRGGQTLLQWEIE